MDWVVTNMTVGPNTASYRDQFDNKELKIQQYFFCLLTHQISA